MRIYIAGPMAGLPGMNFEAFNAKAVELRAQGHMAVNPVDIGEVHFGNSLTVHPTEYLRADIRALLHCDAICLLPDWHKSRGARIEAAIAKMLGFTFIDGQTNLAISPPDKVCIATDYSDWQPPEASNGT